MLMEIIELGLPVGLLIIMFSLGLELSPADFRRVFLNPRDFLVGAASQVVLLPLVAFLIVSAWPTSVSAELAIGLMILAAAPGGVTSNILTRLAGGDTALSISLTAVITLFSIVSVPLIVFFAFNYFGDGMSEIPSIASTAIALCAMVAVPVGAGIFVRARNESWAKKSQKAARRISIIVLVSLLTLALIDAGADLWRHSFQAALLALTLNITMMSLAVLVAKVARLGLPQRISLSLECGLQSTPLALTLIVVLGLNEAYMLPAAFYGVIMLLTGVLFAGLLAATPSLRRRSPVS